MFLIVRPANGRSWHVGSDMSTIQRRSLDKVPEVVAREADAGRIMCTFEWFDIMTLLPCEKEGFRIDADRRMSSRGGYCSSSPAAEACCSSKSSGVGDSFFGLTTPELCTVLERPLAPACGTCSLLRCANSAASLNDIADEFFCLDLKENLGLGWVAARTSSRRVFKALTPSA